MSLQSKQAIGYYIFPLNMSGVLQNSPLWLQAIMLFPFFELLYIDSMIVLNQAKKHFSIVLHLCAISVGDNADFVDQERCQTIFRAATINIDRGLC
jgi:hypothetical protein